MAMSSLGFRSWASRGPANLPAALAVVACCSMLAACGAAGNGSPVHDPLTRVAASSTPEDGVASSAVVSAWIAAQQAFDDAARSADASQPELAATTVDPQLTWTQSLLTRMRQAGEVALGPVRYGDPRVVDDRAGLATIEACDYDAEIVVSAASEAPVPGDPGRVDFERITSTMELTATGWKLADQTVEVARCHV